MTVWGTRGELEAVAKPLRRKRRLVEHVAGIRMSVRTSRGYEKGRREGEEAEEATQRRILSR